MGERFDSEFYKDQERLHRAQDQIEDRGREMAKKGETWLDPSALQSNAETVEDIRRARTRKHLGIEGSEEQKARDESLLRRYSVDDAVDSLAKIGQKAPKDDPWRQIDADSADFEGEESAD